MFRRCLAKLEECCEADVRMLRDLFSEAEEFCKEFQTAVGAVQLNGNEGSPENPVVDGEVVLGILPEPLRRLYVVRARTARGLKAKTEQLKSRVYEKLMDAPLRDLVNPQKFIDEMEQEGGEEHRKQYRRVDLINTIFWDLVREALNATDVKNIGLREGWKVVAMPEKKRRSPIFTFGQPALIQSGEDLEAALSGMFPE